MSISLADVLITPQLQLRPPPEGPSWTELQVVRMLAANLERGVGPLQQAAVDWTLPVIRGATVGLSVVQKRIAGEILKWDAVAGAHTHLVGSEVARHHSPCGYAVGQGGTHLFSDPARYYLDLAEVAPKAELLVAPVYIHGIRPYGTLWVFANEEGPELTIREAKLLEFLADHLIAAVQIASRRSTNF